MALPWMTALKIIPWKDVIAATPQVVKGAQKLYESVRNRPRPAESTAALDEIEQLSHDPHALAAHITQLQGRVSQLEQQQRDAADLLKVLAEQNEKLVAAVDTLRVRTRWLLRVSYVLIAGLLILAAMLARAT